MSSASSLACAFCILVVFLLLKKGGAGIGPSGPIPQPGPGQPLPIPTLAKKTAPWNIRTIRNETQIKVQGDVLRYEFKKGTHGSESGPAIYANPFGKLPAEAATLSFNAWFPPDWDFVKAGKLLGLSIGAQEGDHASGGEWSPTAGSARLMWRDPEGDSAILKGYVYLAIEGGPAAAYNFQGPQTKAVTTPDERTGYNLWYKKGGGMRLYKNKWNSLSLTVVLNTPGKANGQFSITCNGVRKEVRDIMWRQSAAVKINELYMTAIFGGSDESFAPPRDTYCLFRDFRFSTA